MRNVHSCYSHSYWCRERPAYLCWHPDGGPQVVGCDYKFGQSEGTDTCLIHGGGMNQGITWMSV